MNGQRISDYDNFTKTFGNFHDADISFANLDLVEKNAELQIVGANNFDAPVAHNEIYDVRLFFTGIVFFSSSFNLEQNAIISRLTTQDFGDFGVFSFMLSRGFLSTGYSPSIVIGFRHIDFSVVR